VAQNTRWKLEVIFGGTDNGLESKTRSVRPKKTTLVASFGESAVPFVNLIIFGEESHSDLKCLVLVLSTVHTMFDRIFRFFIYGSCGIC